VPITYDYNAQSQAAKSDDERTYGATAWKRADGREKSKTCEYSVLGVVAAGSDHYGEAFDVCIARDRCPVHWGREITDRDKTQKLRASGKPTQAAKREAAAEAKERREAEQRKQREERWKTFKPTLAKAVHAAAAKLPANLPKPIFAKMISHHQLPSSTTPAQLQKALLEDAIKTVFDRYSWSNEEPRMVAFAKLLGVDVKACEPKAEPVQKSGVKAKKAAKGRAA
jgi:hypothetical protein